MTDDRELKLPVSLPTVWKILRQEGLYKGKRKGEEKKRLKAFEDLRVDVKYLNVHHHLPKYQFTASYIAYEGGIYGLCTGEECDQCDAISIAPTPAFPGVWDRVSRFRDPDGQRYGVYLSVEQSEGNGIHPGVGEGYGGQTSPHSAGSEDVSE